MNTTNYRVSMGFTSLNDNDLLTFATAVHTMLYAQAAYSAPPVTAAALLTSISAFSAAKVAQADGGKSATANKNVLRQVLSLQLRNLAFYVQVACSNELPLLLESGFETTSTSRTRYALDKPTITRITPGLSGEALVTVTADKNARSYQLRVAEVDSTNTPGPFREPVVFPGSRNIPVGDLVPGKLWLFQVRAIGGVNGVSNWSDAVVQRAA